MNGQRQRTVATPEQLERARQNELLRQAYLIKVAERFFNEDHHITGRVQIAISFLRRPTVLPISRQTLIKERVRYLSMLQSRIAADYLSGSRAGKSCEM